MCIYCTDVDAEEGSVEAEEFVAVENGDDGGGCPCQYGRDVVDDEQVDPAPISQPPGQDTADRVTDAQHR